MEVRVYGEPCWLLEAAELAYSLINGVPTEKLTAEGPYCIPKEEVARIRTQACAELDPQNESLRFYFQGVALEGESNRLACLGCNLLYSGYPMEASEPEDMVQALKQEWRDRAAEGLRICGISGFSVDFTEAPASGFQSLSQDLMALEIPPVFRMQLLEVLSAFDLHLDRVACLLEPVVRQLKTLLAPWVEKNQELLEQWEQFFLANGVEEFILRRGRQRFRNCKLLEIALRYFSPKASPGCFSEETGRLRLHMGVSLKPELHGPASAATPDRALAPEEWQYTAMRLMANPARMEMLHLMTQRPMSGQELSQQLGLNSGSVFRDPNSLSNARLLLTEARDGRTYYRTNLPAVRLVTGSILAYLQDTDGT